MSRCCAGAHLKPRRPCSGWFVAGWVGGDGSVGLEGEGPVNGQQDLRVGGHRFSVLVDSRIPGGRTRVLRVCSGQWCDSFPVGGFGEAVGAAFGDDDVGVV